MSSIGHNDQSQAQIAANLKALDDQLRSAHQEWMIPFENEQYIEANAKWSDLTNDQMVKRVIQLVNEQQGYQGDAAKASSDLKNAEDQLNNDEAALNNKWGELAEKDNEMRLDGKSEKDIEDYNNEQLKPFRDAIQQDQVNKFIASESLKTAQDKVADIQARITQGQKEYSDAVPNAKDLTPSELAAAQLARAAVVKSAYIAATGNGLLSSMSAITADVQQMDNLRVQAAQAKADYEKDTALAASTGAAAGATSWACPFAAAALAITSAVYASKAVDAKKDEDKYNSQADALKSVIDNIISKVEGAITDLEQTQGADLQQAIKKLKNMINEIIKLVTETAGGSSQSKLEKVEVALAEILGALGSILSQYNADHTKIQQIVDEAGQAKAKNEIAQVTAQVSIQEILQKEQQFMGIFMKVVECVVAIAGVALAAATGGEAAVAVAAAMAALTVVGAATNHDLISMLTDAIAKSIHTGNKTADKVVAEFLVAVMIMVVTLGAGAAEGAAKDAQLAAQAAMKEALTDVVDQVAKAGGSITKEELQTIIQTATEKVMASQSKVFASVISSLSKNENLIGEEAKVAMKELVEESTDSLVKQAGASFTKRAGSFAGRAGLTTTAGFFANNGLVDGTQLIGDVAEKKKDANSQILRDIKYAMMAIQAILAALAGGKAASGLSNSEPVIESIFGTKAAQTVRMISSSVVGAGQAAVAADQMAIGTNMLKQADVQEKMAVLKGELDLQNNVNKTAQEMQTQFAQNMGGAIAQVFQMVQDLNNKVSSVDDEMSKILASSVA